MKGTQEETKKSSVRASGSYQGTPSGVPQRDWDTDGFSRCGAVGREWALNSIPSAVLYDIAEAVP